MTFHVTIVKRWVTVRTYTYAYFLFFYQYVPATKNRKCWTVPRFIEKLPYQFKQLIHSFKEEIAIAV